ncbi:hypothetical protein [Synechococcus sp. R6-5]|uniref:hypothetical protein n=1 Tax=Synechococcus sp. R6-5 TaxID=2421326 RepID=UPI0039C48C86
MAALIASIIDPKIRTKVDDFLIVVSPFLRLSPFLRHDCFSLFLIKHQGTFQWLMTRFSRPFAKRFALCVVFSLSAAFYQVTTQPKTGSLTTS